MYPKSKLEPNHQEPPKPRLQEYLNLVLRPVPVSVDFLTDPYHLEESPIESVYQPYDYDRKPSFRVKK